MGPHQNFVVIALVIMKAATGMKFDLFYTTVTKTFVMSLLLPNYGVVMYYTPGHLCPGCVVHNYSRFLMVTILWQNFMVTIL